MAKRAEVLTPDEIWELRREMAELKDNIRVLSDVLYEIREEISWLTRNGLPIQEERLHVAPVVKRMALNPAASDWAERLEIARGDCDDERPSAGTMKPPPGQVVCQPGDQGRLF